MQRTQVLPLALLGLIACSSDDGDRTSIQHEVDTASGGVLASADQKLQVQIPAAAFVEPTATVSITTADGATATPVPEAALGPAYVVETAATPSATFSATLAFQIDSATVEALGGPTALGVAHGAVLGQAWDEILTGSYDATNQVYVVSTTSFSYFALIDVNKAGGVSAGGDDGGVQGSDASQDAQVGVGCAAGQTRACTCTQTGVTSSQSCVEGQWGACACALCTDGETQDCTCSDTGAAGTQTCASGQYGACECSTTDPCEGVACSTQEYCEGGECVFGDDWCEVDAECDSGFCCSSNYVCVPVDSYDGVNLCTQPS